jgi:hypothetical protein
MKTRKLLIVAGLTLTTLLILQMIKNKKSQKRRMLIAEEGYETAEDILFPGRYQLRMG